MFLLGMTVLFATVDINNASKKELISLKGIGSKKADAIVEYRQKNCFNSIKSLTEVKGIGLKFIENNKNNLIVGKCKKH